MDEDILAAIIREDEAEAARRIVPFDDAVKGDGGPAGRFARRPLPLPAVPLPAIPFPGATAETLAPRWPSPFAWGARREGGGVEIEDLADRAPFGALGPFEGDAGAIRCFGKTGAFQ